ncbi:hypothetical protein [endosymbiont of Ridgeia piscesae]|uniref:Uncharacterized protein n=1 Tax=endosymbiont of Ridgeia piscesae TaxID=54398 RepID=A0A0T5YX02_9GAMM|nr:hypothetical protein [endosymbiont of Ridgeia piscesae]KRT55127.1 hypothetical protein Ga0074115_11422 [endosymbiont of Ridgeia piscesae]KRT58948.1 hypothetical protein Ga0076813_14563 [endosymbiont of Ridgeia piscesae]
MRAWRPRLTILLLLLATPAASWAEERQNGFGRLFTSAEQRYQLDNLLRQPNAEPFTEAAVEPPPAIHLKGTVFRPHQRNISWVNDHSTLKTSRLSNGIDVQDRHADRDKGAIPLQYGTAIKQLKPGQVWLLQQQRVVEAIDLPTAQPLPTQADAKQTTAATMEHSKTQAVPTIDATETTGSQL